MSEPIHPTTEEQATQCHCGESYAKHGDDLCRCRAYVEMQGFAEAWRRLVESIAIILEVNPYDGAAQVGRDIQAAIERLRRSVGTQDFALMAENARFRAALTKIAAYDPGKFRPLEDEISIWRLATEALSGDSHD